MLGAGTSRELDEFRSCDLLGQALIEIWSSDQLADRTCIARDADLLTRIFSPKLVVGHDCDLDLHQYHD
jgi:hypothetical protein